MEFDVESDPETLYELFGKDNADSFAEYALYRLSITSKLKMCPFQGPCLGIRPRTASCS